MTWAQWLFEYHAIRMKEKDEANLVTTVMKHATRTFRETLISLFGLGAFVPADQEAAYIAAATAAQKAGEDLPPRPFVPGAFMFSNHHLLKGLYDAREKSEKAEQAAHDEAFEAFSAALARGETAGMNPVLLGDLPVKQDFYWHSLEAKQALHALGVKSRPANMPPAPHIGRKKGVQILEDAEGLFDAE